MKSSHQLVFLPTGPTTLKTLSSSEVCTTLNALHQRPTLDSKQAQFESYLEKNTMPLERRLEQIG
ncbi:hypothetical protein OUZ56_020806 [Daphnia magna]|uniref:Uncharacterized protein n=1 Tax=Daphnia magna TaxID=35525 RepID=A0ABQ9ZFH8_9CRUS|nr:hypothetical protein OUZ56_020806 [Daphnia magna]